MRLEDGPICVTAADEWYDWVVRARHGDDPQVAATLAGRLAEVRDRVLDHAALRPGAHIADIGTGDGLVAFGALERELTASATLVDISPRLIAHARALAGARGVTERCSFVVGSADALTALADRSVDVVTARAVLAYVADKPAALREFLRILRPGGRLSIADPIFADRAYVLAGIKAQLAAGQTGSATTYFDFVHRCGAAQLPDTLTGIAADPLTNYTERDVLRFVESAGFVNAHLRLHIDSVPAPAMPWPAYLASAMHAGVPSVGEILAARFSAAERATFEEIFRPGVEAGTNVERTVNAFVYAQAP